MSSGAVPAEPPIGTWVRDRYGATSKRQVRGWRQPGMEPCARWADMWRGRGPLVVCEPWGK